MIFVGIDPGLTGALAFISPAHGLVGVHDMPVMENDQPTAKGFRKEIDVQRLRAIVRMVCAADLAPIAFLESSAAHFGPSIHTSVSLAESRAYVQATLRLMGIDVRKVTPQAWKRIYGIGSDKDEALSTARRMFGMAGFERKKDHNRAEAALIAHYGYRSLA